MIQIPTKKKKGETEISPRLDIFVGDMKYKHLTREQRYTISQCLKKGVKQNEIAELIGASPSTTSREKKKNATKIGCYKHKYAQMLAMENIAYSAKNKSTPKRVKRLALSKLVEE